MSTSQGSEYPQLSREGVKAETAYYSPQNMQSGARVQYVQQPYIVSGIPNSYLIADPMIDQTLANIHDWLPWSIVNLFIGWLVGGILPLVFSLICRSNKQAKNLEGARTMSTLALVFNILATLGGIGAWITLIVILVAFREAVCTLSYPYCR